MNGFEEFREKNKEKIDSFKKKFGIFAQSWDEMMELVDSFNGFTEPLPCDDQDCETCPLDSDQLCIILSSIFDNDMKGAVEAYRKTVKE